jgi:murein DD-endopeptidase MepM/ murein hydrolase activator NlpD
MSPGEIDARYRPQPTQYGSNDPFGGAGAVSGSVGNPSGNGWESVNQWNSQIAAAINRVQQMTGVAVPANVVKAVMKLESGGVNVGNNFAGYGGLMQVGAGSNVSDWDPSYAATPEGNIYYGVQELANWYKAVGTGNWIDASAAYFSGYNYDNPGVSDGYGTTVGQYRQTIQNNLAQLQSGAQGSLASGGLPNGYQPGSVQAYGSAPMGGNRALGYLTNGSYGSMSNPFAPQGGGYSGGMSGSNASGQAAMSLAFGNMWDGSDDFAVTSDNGLYDYGTQYGLNGVQHTGMDIVRDLNSPIYAPFNATVSCVGCWRNDHITNGVGRIQLTLDNGVQILFDHSNQSYVQEGQRVTAGQLLGTNGGMYVPHSHLEVRVPDNSMPAVYRLVDPLAYFSQYAAGNGGAVTGGGGGYSGGGGSIQAYGGGRALGYLTGRY